MPCDLQHYFKSDKLKSKLVDLAPKDIVGASVYHLLKDNKTGEGCWSKRYRSWEWKGKSSVFYHVLHWWKVYDFDESGNVMNILYEITLMDNYFNAWLHIHCVDLTNDGVNFEFKHWKYIALKQMLK